MRQVFSICVFLSLCVTAFAAASPNETPSVPAPIAAAPVVASPPAPAVAVNPSVPGPQVSVAEPSAPPEWAQELIVSAENLPVVGPVISKALVYLGILSSILTMTVGFLLAVLNVVMGVVNLAGLADVSTKLAAFRDGKVMYWLKFFSLFNARKKPDDVK